MAKPERRSVLMRAPRAEGEAAIGLRPQLVAAPALVTPETAVEVPLSTVEVSPPVETTTAPEAAPPVMPVPPAVDAPVQRNRSSRPKARKVASPVPSAKVEAGEGAWQSFGLPVLSAPSVTFEPRVLLLGPARITTIHLPLAVASALRQIKFQLDHEGKMVTQSTLVAHSLCYAFTHIDEWLDLSPVDGRRKAGETNLSMQGKRTSFGLTQGLRDATDALLWRAVAEAGERAPAKLTLQATAIAWGLSQMTNWIDYALAHPVTVTDGAD